jgi:hypothetical protein
MVHMGFYVAVASLYFNLIDQNPLFDVTPQYKNQVKLSAATLFWPYMSNPAISIPLLRVNKEACYGGRM